MTKSKILKLTFFFFLAAAAAGLTAALALPPAGRAIVEAGAGEGSYFVAQAYPIDAGELVGERPLSAVPATAPDQFIAGRASAAPPAGHPAAAPFTPDSPTGPGRLAPQIGVNFDGMESIDCCTYGMITPPDPDLAAGLSHIVTVINTAFAVYDKAGNLLLPTTHFSTFFDGVPGCTTTFPPDLFEPAVLYDESTDRYFMGVDSQASGYCAAVSQTNDPTGGWNRYYFPMGGGLYFEDGYAGVGREAFFLGGNLFQNNTGPFVNSYIWAMDKAAMVSGTPASIIGRPLNAAFFTPQPANLHGYLQGGWPTGGPHYFITATNFESKTQSVLAWDDPFGANILTTVGSYDLDTASGVTSDWPLFSPQSGGGDLEQADIRPQDAEYRHGSLWTVQTISCDPGGGPVNCTRWAEIDPASATVLQAGVLASPGDYRIFADLAVNHCGDMAIGYTKTSGVIYPAIWITGRDAEDPAGTLDPELELKAGETPYGAFDFPPYRWGEYSGMAADPNGIDFWYYGEYSKIPQDTRASWGTYIGQITFSNPGAQPKSGAETPLDWLLDGSGSVLMPMAAFQPLCP